MHVDEKGLVEAVAAAILDYLQAHPLAADTASGVARWWLGPVHSNVTVEQGERALDLLVSRRLLRCRRLMDGKILYSEELKARH